MKIKECRVRNIHDVGFIDPHIVNGHVLERYPADVEASSYESDVAAQVEEVKSRKNYGGLRDMILKTTESWVVE